MKREQVKNIIPDITDEQLNKLLNIHSEGIGKAKGEFDKVKGDLDKANEDIEKYQSRIAELEEAVNNGDDFKKKFEDLKKEIEDEKAEAKRKAEEEAAENALAERFKTVVGENKWRDELTGEAVYSKFKAALADEANKGKGDKDILDALTKDQNYWLNPNQPANMTGINKNTSTGDVTDDQIRAVMGLPPKTN
jgi:chromosome segregation ATPase